MWAIFDDSHRRLAATFNGLTLNDPTDDPQDYYEISEIVPRTSYEAVTDANAQRDGMEVYEARKVVRTILVRGMIRAPSIAALYDKTEALAVAFDPALASLNNPSTDGFLPLDFSVPTEDRTNYLDGFIPSRYYLRALDPPDPPDSRYIGTSQRFAMTLMARDPRRYLQSTLTLAGAGTFANTKADYISWPTVTITMAGAGSSTYQVANSTLGRTVWLDLSGRSPSDIVVVDMENQQVTINGTVNNGIVGTSTAWFWVKPGNNTIAVTNGTNATTSTTARPAFVI
jgi:hypothetical protein